MRKKKAPKRYVQPDPKFGDVMVTQFVNRLMYEGKKSVAYGVFYGALELIEERTKENGMEIWKKALNTLTTMLTIILISKTILKEMGLNGQKILQTA